MAKAHVIVLGNEKGGTGKSTTAVHLSIALMLKGLRVGAIDLDSRQQTFGRYIDNRKQFADGHGLQLAVPRMLVIDDRDSDAETLLSTTVEAWSPICDVIVIDTPGRDSTLTRAALGRADTLITPMNDSFVDFDLIGHVDAETYKVKRPSFYAEAVWDARKARAKLDGGSVDWVVIRNRMSNLVAHNMVRVGGALDELSKRIGFRIAPGLSERVIYKELFPRGLTLLDIGVIDDVNLSHIAARNELRELVAALALPSSPEPAQVVNG
jgi:chromosome partitioning protein